MPHLAILDRPEPDTTDMTEIESQGESLLAKAHAIIITDQVTYVAAARLATEFIDPFRKMVKEKHNGLIAKANDTHKAAIALRDEHLVPADAAKKITAQKCQVFEDEQAKLQHEAQLKIELEAKRIVEEDALRAATQAEQMGEAPEVVDAILEEKVAPPPVVAAPVFERAKGVTRKAPLKAEVTHLPSLIKYVEANPLYSNYLIPNMAALNAAARSLGSRFAIPGCKVTA